MTDTQEKEILEVVEPQPDDRLLRLAAELENQRRRYESQLDETRKYGSSKVINDLIQPLETLILVEAKIDEAHREAISICIKEFTKTLEKHGCIRITPIDEPFDPNLHQAIVQLPSDKASGTILEVMQAGYVLNGRVLKPALVSVSA
jgi:molecular chaperone GrpE